MSNIKEEAEKKLRAGKHAMPKADGSPSDPWEVHSVNTMEETNTTPDNTAVWQTSLLVSVTSINTETGETKTEPIPTP